MWRQMVRYLSILTLSLFLTASAGAVPLRVLMENTQATNNALFVSTQTGSVYVQTGGSMTVKGGGGLGVTYGVTASTMGIGGAPSGTRKFQVYFNANNNSPSYGDGAVRYLDSVNGVGFECGALYGGSQPSWCQSGNDGMGSKKPFVFQPDGSNVGIRTLSPATTAALEVAGPVSVGGSGNTQYSLQASSGASFGSDLHVTGTLEATKLKGDGSQLTGVGGGGTVTTQGSAAAGQVAVFQAGTILSSSPISIAFGAGGASTATANFTSCTGIGCRIDWSSGAAQGFSFTIPPSSGTYTWSFRSYLTTGTVTPVDGVYKCVVSSNGQTNIDTTVTHYYQNWESFPNSHNLNNIKTTANFRFWYTAGGAVAATDFTNDEFTIQATSAAFTATGTENHSYSTWGTIESNKGGFGYRGLGPWLIYCAPQTTGFGVDYDTKLWSRN
jgi:hypothetical protein